MSQSPTPRARARARTLTEIKGIARRQIATDGASALSLRGVARELGFVSSAVYRYYDSRDALLTALIADSFDQLASVLVAKVSQRPQRDHRGRFIAACAGLRDWARTHPHEFTLIYGSPIPGYIAPADTIGPAARVADVYAGVLRAARNTDRLAAADPVPGPKALLTQLADAGSTLGDHLPPDTVAALFSALTELIGLVSLELSGHLVGTLDPADRYARLAFARLADRVGLPPA